MTVERRLTWDACVNVRDLGGLRCGGATIKHGRLVRASILGSLTDAGRAAIRAHGIRTVVDLRGDDEVAEAPSPYAQGLTYRRAPVNSMRMMALHEGARAGTLEDELRRIAVKGGGFADAVVAIAESEPGILLHCTAGRDRTGIVVATILAAIGVHDEQITADYAASDDELMDEYARFKAANPERAASVDEAVAKRAWVMAETLSTIRRAFGGAATYLDLAGVRPAHLSALRMKLVA